MNMSDWSLWRSFSAVVEHGSLSGAARALGLSQHTWGREIEALFIGPDFLAHVDGQQIGGYWLTP